MRSRLSKLPLLWRVFAANAIVLALAFAGLVLAPVTVSVPVAASELAVLVALLGVDLMLLRPALLRSTSWPTRCVGTIRSRPAHAPSCLLILISPRWRRRSMPCSIDSSTSAVRACNKR